jgi:hypothetical protein
MPVSFAAHIINFLGLLPTTSVIFSTFSLVLSCFHPLTAFMLSKRESVSSNFLSKFLMLFLEDRLITSALETDEATPTRSKLMMI